MCRRGSEGNAEDLASGFSQRTSSEPKEEVDGPPAGSAKVPRRVRWWRANHAGVRPASACPATGPPRGPAAVTVLNSGQPASPPQSRPLDRLDDLVGRERQRRDAAAPPSSRHGRSGPQTPQPSDLVIGNAQLRSPNSRLSCIISSPASTPTKRRRQLRPRRAGTDPSPDRDRQATADRHRHGEQRHRRERGISAARPTASGAAVFGRSRGRSPLPMAQKEEEPCCRHDDRRRGGPSPVVMATRGCGFLPRHFASTPTPRSDGQPTPGVRRTFGPPLCSSCDASG